MARIASAAVSIFDDVFPAEWLDTRHYQNAAHRASVTKRWFRVPGTERTLTDVGLPNYKPGAEFTLCDATSRWGGPPEFKVITLKLGVYDRNTGILDPPFMGLTGGVMLPLEYTQEQLMHRCAWVLRGAFDHEWREHFIAYGARVFDPHAEGPGLTL